MSELKREIKQNKPFSTIEEEVYLNLQRTAYLLREKIVEILDEYDLSEVQYNILRILRGAGEDGLSFDQISERLVRKDDNIKELLDSLEIRDLLSQEEDSYSNLIYTVKITRDGISLVAKLDEPTILRNKVTLGHLGEDLLLELNELLVLARKRAIDLEE